MKLKSLISIFVSLLMTVICADQDKNDAFPPIPPEPAEIIRLRAEISCQQENRETSMHLLKLKIRKQCKLTLNHKLILRIAVFDDGKISSYKMIEIKDKSNTLDGVTMYKAYPCICTLIDSTNLGYTDLFMSNARSENFNLDLYTFLLN